ncbi:MAG: 30S ribosomal protein S2 [Parcubacteria group bacterium ADurb.Bin305]|jgi:small subunit ribosomal protein S2|nr:30S ribosomal protein S2 [Candidatus Paceibacterota bacterium]OQA44345.1 MAG: 30S ribosomal protein S2 [Parcubacteria group bacterium ADurb.Bin305]
MEESNISTYSSGFALNLDELEKAGLQYGHKLNRVHPKAKYFTIRQNNSDIAFINLEETRKSLVSALNAIKEKVQNQHTILFVGTQASARNKIQEIAEKYNYPFIANKWLGGILTNFKTLSSRITSLKEMENQKASGAWEQFTKKERQLLEKKLEQLEKKFAGIRQLNKLPDMLFVIDPQLHQVAIKEARQMHLPIVAVLDTDDDPNLVDFPIIANDSTRSAIDYILNKVDEVIQEGQKSVSLGKAEGVESSNTSQESTILLNDEVEKMKTPSK